MCFPLLLIYCKLQVLTKNGGNMSKVNLTLNVVLDEGEFVKIDEHVYTTKASLQNEETKVHIVDKCCLEILNDFKGKLNKQIVDEWLLLSRALDQSCNYENSWDDRKILEELIEGSEHSVSWYALNCRAN